MHLIAVLQPIGAAGHHASCAAHQSWERRRQFDGTGRSSRLRMRGLVALHLRDDLSAPLIVGRQAIQVTGQMTFDLTLSLGHEAKAEFIAQSRRGGSDRKRTQVP